MIEVTRLNNSKLWVNADMIEFVEATPDTVISLVTHEKIIVKEHPAQIVAAVIEFRRQIMEQRPQIKEREG
jgi:flagellar protein FlbD